MDFKTFKYNVYDYIDNVDLRKSENILSESNRENILSESNRENISKLLFEVSQNYFMNSLNEDSSENGESEDSSENGESEESNDFLEIKKKKYEESLKILNCHLWDWKNIHTYPGFEWHMILYIPDKLNRDAIHNHPKLNWSFVINYRTHIFWDWDKLSSRKDSFGLYKRTKKLPWRMNSMIRTFDTLPDFWEYVFKNPKDFSKDVYQILSHNPNLPLENLVKYPQSRDLWDWSEITKLSHLTIGFVRENTILPWDWDIISYRF